MKFTLIIFTTFFFGFTLLQTQNVSAQVSPYNAEARQQGNPPPSGNRGSDPRFPTRIPGNGMIISSRVLTSRETSKIELKNGELFLNATPPNYERAAYWLELAVGDNPKSKRAFTLLGLAYNHQGLFAKAVAAYDKALQLDEKSVDALVGLGTAHFNLKDYKTAIENYEKALKLDERNFNANIMLANSHFISKRFDLAADGYQKALRIDSKSIEANFNLALCYLHLNNREAAVKQNELLKTLDKSVSEKLEDILNKKADLSGGEQLKQ